MLSPSSDGHMKIDITYFSKVGKVVCKALRDHAGNWVKFRDESIYLQTVDKFVILGLYEFLIPFSHVSY